MNEHEEQMTNPSLKRSTWTDKMLSWLLGRVMFGRSQPSPSKQPLAQVTSLKYSNNKYLADLKSTSLLNDLLKALMISWSGSEKRFIWAGIESVRTLSNTTPKCRHLIFYATSTAVIHLVFLDLCFASILQHSPMPSLQSFESLGRKSGSCTWYEGSTSGGEWGVSWSLERL